MLSGSIEERLARLERAYKRQKLFSNIRLLIYIILIVGVIIYLVNLYNTMDQWKVEATDPPRIGIEAFPVMKVEAPVRIFNPDGDVRARMVYYKIYINGYYAGDGFIPYLDLRSGRTEHSIKAEIDLSRTSCGIAKALVTGQNITIRIEGYAMVDLKAFGKIPWRTVTVPFNLTLQQVPPPTLDQNTRSLLTLYVYACENSSTILQILQYIAQSGGSGGTPNWSFPIIPWPSP